MGMTRHFVNVVIKELGWRPYIKGGWIDFGRGKAGSYITFEGHESHRYKCSNKIAQEIIESAKSRGL